MVNVLIYKHVVNLQGESTTTLATQGMLSAVPRIGEFVEYSGLGPGQHVVVSVTHFIDFNRVHVYVALF